MFTHIHVASMNPSSQTIFSFSYLIFFFRPFVQFSKNIFEEPLPFSNLIFSQRFLLEKVLDSYSGMYFFTPKVDHR